MAVNERNLEERGLVPVQSPAYRVIDTIDDGEFGRVMERIDKFQKLVKARLKDNTDYGVIPGTGKKPTLLKPGAEKICMLLGVRSEFEIVESTRNWENGFFQYMVKCKLYKSDMLITEGLGSCNSKERKYVRQDGCSVDNTILKMAKKRALTDAALMVGSLSDIFTQDLDDDIEGNRTEEVTEIPKAMQNPEAKASKQDVKKAFSYGTRKGFTADQLQTLMQELGIDKSDDMTVKDVANWKKLMDKREIKEGDGNERGVQEVGG